jgi:hypothetical protein
MLTIFHCLQDNPLANGVCVCVCVCINASNEGLLGKMALTNFLWEKLGYVKSDPNGLTIAYNTYISEE